MRVRRLQALPAGPLSLITRAAGRPSRRASKQLLDAYGPLDCGLRLINVDDLASVLAMLAQNRRPYTHTKAMSLQDIYTGAEPSNEQICSNFVAAISTAFPLLQSLSLPPCACCASCQPSLSHLTALSSSLTSLTVPGVPELAAALQRMQPLTHLRTLTVSAEGMAPSGSSAEFQAMMDELNSLPQLQQLHLCDTERRTVHLRRQLSAAAHLPSLRCAENLTHLSCGLHLVEWDDAAIRTLSSGLPRLSSLALNIGAFGLAPDPTATILEAISQHTALTALDLDLDHPHSDHCTFEVLSSLRLRSCRMHLGQNCDTASLLEALGVQGSLRQLRLDCEVQEWMAGTLDSTCLQHLARLAGTLELLDLELPVDPAANLLEAVGKLTNLKALRLAYLPGAQAAAWVTSDVTCLAQLRSLAALEVADNGAGFVAAVVGSASGLVGLKELKLCGPGWDKYGWGSEDTQYITGSDLWQLLPLQPHLTRLVLAELQHVVGPGCEALRVMVGLQQLDLIGMRISALHLHLLPLPPSLRIIHVYWLDYGLGQAEEDNEDLAVATLREAGRRQDCTVQVEDHDEGQTFLSL
jgi:hypothetical protein